MIQQTRTRPQETLELKTNKQIETFSLNPSLNVSEEDEWLIAVTSFEAMNSVFNITDENNSLLITTPGPWQTKSVEKTNSELNKLYELRSQNGVELHVKEVRKRGNQIN